MIILINSMITRVVINRHLFSFHCQCYNWAIDVISKFYVCCSSPCRL